MKRLLFAIYFTAFFVNVLSNVSVPNLSPLPELEPSFGITDNSLFGEYIGLGKTFSICCKIKSKFIIFLLSIFKDWLVFNYCTQNSILIVYRFLHELLLTFVRKSVNLKKWLAFKSFYRLAAYILNTFPWMLL